MRLAVADTTTRRYANVVKDHLKAENSDELKFVVDEHRKESKELVLMPNSAFKKAWDLLIIVLVVYNLIFTPPATAQLHEERAARRTQLAAPCSPGRTSPRILQTRGRLGTGHPQRCVSASIGAASADESPATTHCAEDPHLLRWPTTLNSNHAPYSR